MSKNGNHFYFRGKKSVTMFKLLIALIYFCYMGKKTKYVQLLYTGLGITRDPSI